MIKNSTFVYADLNSLILDINGCREVLQLCRSFDLWLNVTTLTNEVDSIDQMSVGDTQGVPTA